MKTLLRVIFALSIALDACSSPDAGPSNGPHGSSGGSTGGGGTSVGSGGSNGSSGGGENGTGGSSDGGSAGEGGTGGAVDEGGTAGSEGTGGSTGDGGVAPNPFGGNFFDQFMNVAKGSMESDPIARTWTAPPTPPDLAGDGIAQHPMLYAGEGYNTIFLVNKGQVIWTYSTGSGGEIDDVWMLSNGHILYARMNYLEEITAKKEVVWHYVPPAGTESHSLQPLGLDKVLFVQNGQPAKIIVMDKKTMAKEVEHELPDTLGLKTHPQFRRIRMTATGNYLAPYLNGHKVVEYDKDFKIVWSFPPAGAPAWDGTPWAAIRLHNGNTLIQDEHNKTAHEVSPTGQMVWEYKQTDLPAGLNQSSPQTSDRLANGNTVIWSPGKVVGNIQGIEVNPAKQAVWVLQDWKNLGPATTAQFLDEPGIPENPGELQH
jgi:hypothetical protein